MMKALDGLFWCIALCGWLNNTAQLCAQGVDVIDSEAVKARDGLLLKSAVAQFEMTEGINDLYNFKFERARNRFLWFKEKHPTHPMPAFLLGLNEWWQIMPDVELRSHDEAFYAYMDETIKLAKQLYRADRDNPEAAFFLSAAYAFRGRLHAERKHWLRAASDGKAALAYLNMGKEWRDLSLELQFGQALYNFYSVYIHQEFPMLRPLMWFMKRGNKDEGLKQLQEVANNAFYTRTEAQYFLLRIYRVEDNQPQKAFPIAEYLHQTYPDNPYFHRMYAGVLYSLGMFEQLEPISRSLLERVEQKMLGYEAHSGRYGAFFMATLMRLRYANHAEAEKYYQKTIAFAEQTESHTAGYYLAALQELARYAEQRKDYKKAREYYALVKKHAARRSKQRKEAKNKLRDYRRNDEE